jgi:transposase InsO family protein
MSIDQVWSSDITSIRLAHGFVNLVAIIDWFSRYVLDWELSTTLDTSFCLEALDRALLASSPEIFNTDQGYQTLTNSRGSHQLGWAWTSFRHSLRRAAMEECEI